MTATIHPRQGRRLADCATILYRNALALKREPAILAANLAAPLGLVLMFGYVFGGALGAASSADAYRDALIPAVFVLVAGTGLVNVAGATAMDVGNGVTARFRSLPMARFAVPAGAAGSQLLLSLMSLGAMSLVGLAIGWRVDDGLVSAIAGFALVLLFGFALSWVGIYLGLVIRNAELVQQLAPLIFAVVMLSNAFVPTPTMPAALGAVADWNPVSAAIAALRELFGNSTATPDGPLPMDHPVLATVIWSVVLLAIFAPAAARRYGRAR